MSGAARRGTLLAALLAAGAAATTPPALARKGADDPLADADPIVERELRDWNVPGAAVVVVRGDEIALLKGYGRASLQTGAPVTPETRFAIGSITKGFTATLLAMMVDENRLAWDRPVIEILPDFRLFTSELTDQVTVKDLLAHRTGIPRHDMTWYRSGQTRDALYAALRYLPPRSGLRDRWQYQNLMYMTAGRVAEQCGGQRWEDLLKERLLLPLGLKGTGFWTQATAQVPEFAAGYAERDGELVRTPFLDLTGIGPAASLYSTAQDLGNWIRFQLEEGFVGERRLVSAVRWADLHRPQILADAVPFPEFSNDAYALGWRLSSYRGRPAFGHDGMVDGFSSILLVVPGNRLGIAVLANRDDSLMPLAVTLELLDRLLGAPPAGWGPRLRARQAKRAADRAALEAIQEKDRKAGTVPSHPLADYAGEYEHPAYGSIHVVEGPKGLTVNHGEMTSAMQHWHFETFRAPMGRLPAQGLTFLHFETNLQGDVDALLVPFEESAPPIVFRRRPSPILSDPSHLARLAGTYASEETRVRVRARGKGLQLEIFPGEVIELAPYRGSEYRSSDGSATRARFTPEEGPATEVEVITPRRVLRASRLPEEPDARP